MSKNEFLNIIANYELFLMSQFILVSLVITLFFNKYMIVFYLYSKIQYFYL